MREKKKKTRKKLKNKVHSEKSLLKVKEGLTRSEVAKEVIGKRKRFFKKKYISIKTILPPWSPIKIPVPTLKIDGINVGNLKETTKPLIKRAIVKKL